MTFRKVILKLHLWTGLACAIFLLILGVTGSILEWQPEVDRAQLRQVQKVTIEPQGQILPMSELWASVQKAAPRTYIRGIRFGLHPFDPYVFFVSEKSDPTRSLKVYTINEYTGEILPNAAPIVRRTWLSNFMGATRSLHKTLWAGRNGEFIVSCATLATIFLILTGIIVWWRQKILRITKSVSWRRFNFDSHSVVGIYSLVFFLILSFTGAMIYWPQIGQWIIKAAHQHEARFGGRQSLPPIPGAQSLSLNQVVAKVETLPGERTIMITWGLGRPTDAIFVSRQGAKGAILGSLNQYTGRVLAIDDPGTRPWAVQLAKSVEDIHEGGYFGWAGRIIACIASTAIPVMVITGFIIWWRRKLTEWQRRARAAGRLMSQEQKAR